MERHAPVFFDEAIDLLRVRPGTTVVDCTIGLAGHAAGIARLLGPQGHLIGFDRDAAGAGAGQREVGWSLPGVRQPGAASYFDRRGFQLDCQAFAAGFGGWLAGRLWSEQPATGRGAQRISVSWRMGRRICAWITRSGPTAAQVVNEASERELADLIYEYGEERRSRRIARAIVRGRPVTTTGQLARIVTSAAPAMKQEHIHPATRTFQALRIYVNRELDEIRALLEAAPRLLKPSARLVVISFHSLEDRIAKDSLREGARQGIWEILTKKPVTAGEEEIERNPRSRSAKLRAAERQLSASFQSADS